MFRRATLVLICLVPLPAQAADADGRFAVDGAGTATCAQLTAAVQAQDVSAVAAFGHWSSGFISATNASTPDTFDLTPWQTEGLILSQLEVFCGDNPDVLFFDALRRLLQVYARTKLSADSETVTLGPDGQEVRLYTAVVDGMRQTLTDLGYDVADGTDGVTQALAAFQSDNDLDPTGAPDQRTLLRLFNR